MQKIAWFYHVDRPLSYIFQFGPFGTFNLIDISLTLMDRPLWHMTVHFGLGTRSKITCLVFHLPIFFSRVKSSESKRFKQRINLGWSTSCHKIEKNNKSTRKKSSFSFHKLKCDKCIISNNNIIFNLNNVILK